MLSYTIHPSSGRQLLRPAAASAQCAPTRVALLLQGQTPGGNRQAGLLSASSAIAALPSGAEGGAASQPASGQQGGQKKAWWARPDNRHDTRYRHVCMGTEPGCISDVLHMAALAPLCQA